MNEGNVLGDYVIAQLVDMGFEISDAMKAVETVGPQLEGSVVFILNENSRVDVAVRCNPHGEASCARECSTTRPYTNSGKASASNHLAKRKRQTCIADHLVSSHRINKIKESKESEPIISGFQNSKSGSSVVLRPISERVQHKDGEHVLPLLCSNREFVSDWEDKVKAILHNHFGFSSLKSFQKEAIEAWLTNQDCLVLAATGSGKSLCFQIPALLTGKVVVAISPLISLMHDQCLKLAEHGISACFLGSGQSDRDMEHKAMSGMYDVIYVCPETILRLVAPLQGLAERRGIALFAVDEVHCVSKWGHDFRPYYRRLSILRESFCVSKLKFLKSDVPLMALTATATIHVRDDILKSLQMSKETKIVLTSFFRPNLRFSVKHSKTTCMSSYSKDFCEILDAYGSRLMGCGKKTVVASDDGAVKFDSNEISEFNLGDLDDDIFNRKSSDVGCSNESSEFSCREVQLSVAYLEDELDVCQDSDDIEVSCDELYGIRSQDWSIGGTSMTAEPQKQLEVCSEPLELSVGSGQTIIYVPTRKETVRIAKYLCEHGVRAAPYHAKLSKAHLRHVHEEFHGNNLKVVVATIAFGMGIDKSNVRRVIHYGWPQSLEAYYQEAGRAGRDGNLADCTLYADLSRIPTLLPSQRSEEQTKHACKLLSECFRYGMSTSCCRAKTLVEYFGEKFNSEKCLMCDVCVGGLPELQNLKADADAFMQVLAAHRMSLESDFGSGRILDKPNVKIVISSVREKFPEFAATDQLWWRGLSRILEEKGFIREGDNMIRVCIKYPEPTEAGLSFLSCADQSFYVYPEADMLLSKQLRKDYSTFAEWGRGWADPVTRQQRLQAIHDTGKRVKRNKSGKYRANCKTNSRNVRQRIMTKLLKQKR